MTTELTRNSKDRIVFEVDDGGRKLIVGPKSDFQFISVGNSRYWIAGQLVNQTPEGLARNVLENRRFDLQGNDPFSAVELHNDRQTSVACDRYGGVPLFTVNDGTDTWVSTRLSWLLQASGINAKPDERSLAELMTFKFILGTATIVQDVSRIPPATVSVLDANGDWHATEYWRPVPPLQRRTLASQGAALTDAFKSAVKKGIGDAENIGITLSGGLDSRVILAAGLHGDASVTTLTTAIPHGMDYRFAHAAAAAAGVPNVRASLDSDYQAKFFELATESLAIYEGMLLTPGAEPLWLMRHMGIQQFDRVFHGALGELAKGATANHFSVAFDDVDLARNNIADYLARPYLAAHDQLIEMLNPSLASELRGLAIQSLKDTVRDLAAVMDPLDVSFAMQIREHFRNSGVYSSKLWSQKYPIVFPFADPGYVDMLLAVKAEDRLRPQLHRQMIGTLHPGLYHCPESNSGCKVSAPAPIRKLSKLRVRVLKKIGSRRASGHTDYCSWINNMTPNAEDVLTGDSALCRNLWNHTQIPNRIEACRAGNRAAAVALFRMVSIELIFQLLTLDHSLPNER